MVGRHFVTVSSSVITLQGIDKPLWSASYVGNLEMVEVLIDRGAEVNLPNEVRVCRGVPRIFNRAFFYLREKLHDHAHFLNHAR